MMYFYDKFRLAMAEQGIVYDGEIMADGILHRFRVDGDRVGSINGWYVLYASDIPAGSFGCWKREISETWCIKSKEQMTPFERDSHNDRMKEIRLAAELAKKKDHEEAKEIAIAKWLDSTPADPNHPYLQKRGIKPGVLRIEKETQELLAPMFGADKQLLSLQYVITKRFLKCGETKGCFCLIGNINGPINRLYIGEGYITTSTVHEASDCLSVCAFSCSNLPHVAQTMRAQFPNAEIIIAADNDQWSDASGKINNNGIKKAEEAAALINAHIVYPCFDGLDISNKPTDFNDLMQLAGMDEVKAQLVPSDKTPPPIVENTIQATPKINEAAFFGVLKRLVEISRLNSEASAVAITANFIATFCAMVERKAFQWIGDAKIHCRPFFLLIGNSGKARKGTSEYLVRRAFDFAEECLAEQNFNQVKLARHDGGLSSGEGVVYAIRDRADDPNSGDEGVLDKRLLVTESEFANVLAQCKRASSILSSTVRNLFDGKTLAPLTKTNRIRVTNPHVVIIGHITKFELNSRAGPLEASNGFLNRFLICAIERDQLVALPKKTSNKHVAELAEMIVDIINFIDTTANQCDGQIEMVLSSEAELFWESIYPTLSEERPGYIGSLMARVEVYARMLAMIFCLLDKKITIEVNHLQAALFWITYVEESIEYVFGDSEEQKKQNIILSISNRILNHLKIKGEMTKTEIHGALSGHVDAQIINEAMSYLLSVSRVVKRIEPTKGKPKEIFKLVIAN